MTLDRNDHADGYRGIWFRLGQFAGEYGDKYSGGLGTYTMKHVPMAVHAEGTTFFTYGGTRRDERDLLIMAGAYHHEEHAVSRPTVVDTKPEPNPSYDSETVVDPHDNATIAIDGEGHVVVFVAGRGRSRPGRIYRSDEPYSVSSFSYVTEREFFAYPQPWWIEDRFVVLFTIYDEDGNRELFWDRTPDGRPGDPTHLVGIGGHYQISTVDEGTVYTAFNWHPDGDVDRRTNLYVLTTDDGETWRTVSDASVDPPISDVDHHALAWDAAADGRLVYLNDIAVDDDGRPVVLYVTSDGPEPGPENDPRYWELARWTGETWNRQRITDADHNYDSGSLYLTEDGWYVLGPTEVGPQPYGTGGEVACWRSTDMGGSWDRIHRLTADSEYNHTYVRRPHDNAAPFDAFWADGDPYAASPSRLYIGSLDGRCWRLPTSMAADRVELG